MSFVRSKDLVTYSSPRSRYPMRPIRMSGVGLALVISLAMDQIFCLAPSMRPVIDPVVSSTKQTSILGFSFVCGSFASALSGASTMPASKSVTIALFAFTLTLSLGAERVPHFPGWTPCARNGLADIGRESGCSLGGKGGRQIPLSRRDSLRIARRFNAGKHPPWHRSPEGTAEGWGVGLDLSRP